MLRSDEDARLRWLDDHQPAPPAVNWWLYLLLLIDGRREGRPAEQVMCSQLKIWLLGQARERSVLSRGEVAERMAYLVAQVRDAGMAVPDVPSSDAVVRKCVDAIPVSLDQVALRTDREGLSKLTPQERRDSRRARNLLNAAERHLAYLDDPEPARELRAWLAIKPRLV